MLAVFKLSTNVLFYTESNFIAFYLRIRFENAIEYKMKIKGEVETMLSDNLAAKIMGAALERGADFADLFVEQSVSSSLNFLDSKIKNIKTGTDFGVGIRLIYGVEAYYGYTNHPNEEELLKIKYIVFSS